MSWRDLRAYPWHSTRKESPDVTLYACTALVLLLAGGNAFAQRILSGALLFPTDIGVGIGALSILIGPQAYAALREDENSDVMSIALGTELRLLLNRRIGLAVSGQAFYAPDILTFGSADNLSDLSARVEVDVAPRSARLDAAGSEDQFVSALMMGSLIGCH